MIPQQAIDLILNAEGIDQPWEWPGDESGISIGRGYDLGYESARELVEDWSPQIGTPAVDLLLTAVGKNGQAARAIAHNFRGIAISHTAADAVFFKATLPKYEAETKHTFPGCELLPPLAFGALVSLDFNRGPALIGPRRHEMLMISQATATWSKLSESTRQAGLRVLLLTIATQIRSMKRLWGPNLGGLLKRRDDEANLVVAALPSTKA